MGLKTNNSQTPELLLTPMGKHTSHRTSFYPDIVHLMGGKREPRLESARELGRVKERVKAGVTLSEVLCDAVQCFSSQSLPPSPPSLCRSGEEAGSAELLNPE